MFRTSTKAPSFTRLLGQERLYGAVAEGGRSARLSTVPDVAGSSARSTGYLASCRSLESSSKSGFVKTGPSPMSTGGWTGFRPERQLSKMRPRAHGPKAGISDFLTDRLVYLAIGRSLSSSAKSELVWTGHSRISPRDVDKNP